MRKFHGFASFLFPLAYLYGGSGYPDMPDLPCSAASPASILTFFFLFFPVLGYHLSRSSETLHARGGS